MKIPKLVQFLIISLFLHMAMLLLVWSKNNVDIVEFTDKKKLVYGIWLAVYSFIIYIPYCYIPLAILSNYLLKNLRDFVFGLFTTNILTLFTLYFTDIIWFSKERELIEFLSYIGICDVIFIITSAVAYLVVYPILLFIFNKCKKISGR